MKKRAFAISIAVFVVGALTLIGGGIFLTVRLLDQAKAADATKLVEVGAWQSSENPEIIWTFTEIGKGTLTTNNHQNDYDFAWVLDKDTIKIETDWLYTLQDSYTYSLDQGAEIFTVKTESGEINFRPASDVDS